METTIDNNLLMNNGMDIRTEVLRNSLIVERKASVFLGRLLGIENLSKSKILSNSGSSISFNQKIDLLIEIGALQIEHKTKFEVFMAVRNQFMHNIDANTFEKCFSFLDGKNTWLLKNYKQSENTDYETKLNNAFKILTDDVINHIEKIIMILVQRQKEKYEAKLNKFMYEASITKDAHLFNEMGLYERRCNDDGKRFVVSEFFEYYINADKASLQKEYSTLMDKMKQYISK